MKKLIFKSVLAIISLVSLSAVASPECMPLAPTFNRYAYAVMTNTQLFGLGTGFQGVGKCFIMNNNGYYGVTDGVSQISSSTSNSSTAGSYLRSSILQGKCDAPAPLFNRSQFLAMTNQQLFSYGRTASGVGRCIIYQNGSYYGVISDCVQISGSTSNSSTAGSYLRTALMQGKCDLPLPY